MELLVALAVFLLLLSLLLGLLLQELGLTQRGRVQAELQEGVALALEQLSRELRAARAVRQERGTLIATALSGEEVAYRLDPRLRTLVREDSTGSHRLLPAPLEAVAFHWQAEGPLLELALVARHRPAPNGRWQTLAARTAVVPRHAD